MSSTSQSPVDAKVVSEVAHQQGGTTAGSASAQLQSQLTKERNAQQMEDQVKSKMDLGVPPTQKEANLTRSREHRAHGQPGHLAAEAQSAADKYANFEDAAQSVAPKMQRNLSSVTQADASTLESREHRAVGHRPESDSLSADAKRAVAQNQAKSSREDDFQEAIHVVAPKMANDPGQVTQEDASLLHSTDRRAHGTVEKGGITAQAQHLAAENKGDTKS